ncbi:MAG: hypothetical protein M1826_003037 [Phylliscum demangeonii]|nr:MAG: hypothetical protein M1826_003037 [Phylliscum demangeonii]
MRLLPLLPVCLAAAAATAATASPLLLVPRAPPPAGGDGDGDRSSGALNLEIHATTPNRDFATVVGAAGTVAATILGVKMVPHVPERMGELKAYWHGAGGKLYRQHVSGEWNGWDQKTCLRRKSDQLGEAFRKRAPVPDLATHHDWIRICSARKTAELDEKDPRIGQLESTDARGRLIARPPNYYNPGDGNGHGHDHNLNFANQVGRSSGQLWRGFASWERGAAAAAREGGAARPEWRPMLKYAPE